MLSVGVPDFSRRGKCYAADDLPGILTYVSFELLPDIFVGYKIEWALFSRDVVMADDVAFIQAANITKPCGQLYQGFVCGICEFTGSVRVADLDGNRVLIPVVAGGGFFIQRNALNDLAIQTDDKMGADL